MNESSVYKKIYQKRFFFICQYWQSLSSVLVIWDKRNSSLNHCLWSNSICEKNKLDTVERRRMKSFVKINPTTEDRLARRWMTNKRLIFDNINHLQLSDMRCKYCLRKERRCYFSLIWLPNLKFCSWNSSWKIIGWNKTPNSRILSSMVVKQRISLKLLRYSLRKEFQSDLRPQISLSQTSNKEECC